LFLESGRFALFSVQISLFPAPNARFCMFRNFRIERLIGVATTVRKTRARSILFTMDYSALEPKRITSPELAGVLAELSAREPIFHRPEFGTSRADFDRLMAPDYWETGASGRRYAREPILNEMDRRYANGTYEDVWETSDFHCRQLAENVYLLTYTLLQAKQRLTRRATIWKRTPDGWQIVYHQGTIVQDS